MHQIEDETLPAKYDINELEFLKDEFRNGTTVENGAREHIGGSPTRLFLLLWHLGRGRAMLVVEQFESLAVFGVATVDFGLPNTPYPLKVIEVKTSFKMVLC